VLTAVHDTLSMRDVTTTLDPPGEPPVSADGPVRTGPPRAQGASLAIACVLLGAAFLGGAILALAPGQNPLDSWGFSVFPDNLQSVLLRALSDLGLAPVTGGLALLAGVLVWRRDRWRAVACLVGPALAVVLAEVLKVIVGRRFEGVLCWPSGNATEVTAVVTALILVTRGKVRWLASIVGSAVVVFEVVTLVAFRWHYLSDALGGVVLGVGCVMFVDAVVHRLPLPGPRRPRHRRSVPPRLPV